MLTLAENHPCSYLANKEANSIFLDSNTPPSWQQYCNLSKMGFRRSGNHYYRPHCPSCHACMSSRIQNDRFKINKKRFKRIINKASHFTFQLTKPEYSSEHYTIYEQYINTRHKDGDMFPASQEQYRNFLLSELPFCHFFEIRTQDNKLIACTVIDFLDDGISAIYTYFDTDYSDFSLGTLAVLKLHKLATEYKLPYIYLGYWVKDSAKMNYKKQFQPLDVFNGEDWQGLEPAP